MQMLGIFPGGERLYICANSVVMEDGVQNDFQPIPVEFLNSVKTSGLPYALLPFLYLVISFGGVGESILITVWEH
jgi:hypothetical protein